MVIAATGTETQITTNTDQQWHPAISGDRIVWEDRRNGNADIYHYDLSTDTNTQITTGTSMDPAIFGDRIVYADFRNWDNWDIYLYVLGPTTSFTSSCTFTIHPKRGQRVVTVTWANADPGVRSG